MQDNWVVEIRKRLTGKAEGQLYKVWIKGNKQFWTKPLATTVCYNRLASQTVQHSLSNLHCSTQLLSDSVHSYDRPRGPAEKEGFKDPQNIVEAAQKEITQKAREKRKAEQLQAINETPAARTSVAAKKTRGA